MTLQPKQPRLRLKAHPHQVGHLYPQVIQEVPLAHLLANILVTIKPEVAILVIQVVHLDPILDLAVLLQLEHLVDPLVAHLGVAPQVQHPQQVGPRVDLQQEQHLRPQIPVPLNANRILEKILILNIKIDYVNSCNISHQL